MDQVIFVQQAGANRHEHICESLELFGKQGAARTSPRGARSARPPSASGWPRPASARSRGARRPRAPDPDYVITPQGEPRSGAGDRGRARAPDRTAPATPAALRRTACSRRASRAFARARPRPQRRAARAHRRVDRRRWESSSRRWSASFVPEKANGFSGEIQYELTTSNGARSRLGPADRGRAARA